MSGILIIVINLVIILIFRRLDKENLKINKVKRFAEKAIEDIDKYIQTKRQEISDTTIDLEILLKRSQTILSDLEKKWEMASIRQNEFTGKEEKLKEMEQSLKMLGQLAEKTNEGIAFLKKDMVTLDGTRKDIFVISEKVKILEKELTEKIKGSLATAHAMIGEMQKSTHEKINSSFSKYSDLVREYEAKIRTNEENFKVNIQQHLQNLTASINNLEAKFQDIRKKHIDTISRDMVGFREEISSIKKQYSTLEKSLLDKASEKISGLDTAIRTLETTLAEKEDSVLQEGRLKVDEIKNALMDFEGRLKAKEEEVLNGLNKRAMDIMDMVKGVESKVDLIDEKVNEKTKLKLDIFDKNLVNKLAALEEFIKSTESRLLKSVQTDIENVTQKINKISGDMGKKEDDIMLNFNNNLLNINNTFKELNKKISLTEDNALDSAKKKVVNFNEELEKRLGAITDNINLLTRNFDSDLKKKGEIINQSISTLKSSFGETEKKLLKAYNNRVEKFEEYIHAAEEKIKANQEKNIENIKELVNTFDTQISKRMGQVEELIGKREGIIVENSENRIKKLVGQVENIEKRLTVEGSKLLQNQFSKITALSEKIDRVQSQIDDFLKQTKVFNDINKLRTQLNTDFKTFEGYIQKLKKEKAQFSKSEKEITHFMKFTNEMKNSYSDLKIKQKDVEKITSRMDELAGLSKEIDLKIDNINSDKVIVREVEEKIGQINTIYKKVEMEINNLNKKEKSVKDISYSVSLATNRIEDINKRFQLYDKDMENLSKKNERLSRYIKETEDKVLLISRNEEKIEDALSKFEEIDSLRLDIETRVKQIQKMRESLLDQQTEMEKLIKEADSRITSIVTVLDNMKASSIEKNPVIAPEPEKKASKDDKTRTIMRLYGQGWTIAEISRSVNLSESEVQFIIQLNKE
ncbi:MAG: hypothetical protein PHF84_11550 [bacterium]|nr:hypothetical protein [bacterium]